MIGKVSPGDLERYVFSRTGSKKDSVILGPAYGEDTAAIRIGEQILVVNTDPIIFAAEEIGTVGINIASNDVAASGADPEWLTVIYLLPAEEKEALDRITGQIHRASEKLGISIVGG
ncbi:MAG: hydrogenase expression protein, partial [Candidatus Latescibacteria bacterium]|nr:hydrogenase expression protein [bacterium]MBD3425512.1 hydrogenase expression protein [Candidatus Latescibacterota bacterium]